jgi:hypothetical protein
VTPLSPHFTLEELTASQVATRAGFSNIPSPSVIEALRSTAAAMENVRRILGGKVISVSSGFRSPRLNHLIGGAPRSAHILGQAVDFNCFGYGDPAAVCRAISDASLIFDQVIEEGTWVHISFAPAARRQCLTRLSNGRYRAGFHAHSTRTGDQLG